METHTKGWNSNEFSSFFSSFFFSNDEENFSMQKRISGVKNRQSKKLSYFSIQYLILKHSDPFERSLLEAFIYFSCCLGLFRIRIPKLYVLHAAWIWSPKFQFVKSIRLFFSSFYFIMKTVCWFSTE